MSHQQSFAKILDRRASTKLENQFSPRNVIQDARREQFNQTEAKLKSTFGKPYQVSLDETVGFFMNKHTFGMDNYEPRN